ncbi:MAG: hypothetical protein WBL70_12565 [Candidatus Acidiferrales bacterium]
MFAVMVALSEVGLVVCGLLSLNGSFGLAYSASAQEHAPLAAQCQADLAVWYSLDMDSEYTIAETARTEKTPNETEVNKLFLPEIFARTHELGECMEVDSSRRHEYFRASSFYAGVVSSREHSFLVRHNLIGQVAREDAEGER